MIATLAVIFIAAMLQGAVGFGFGLVAMPLLALMIDAPSAAALVALSSATLSASMLIRNRKAVHFGEAAGLILAAAAGVPVGVFALAHAPRQALLIGLGFIVSFFSLVSLAQKTPFEIRDRRWRFLAGFSGGVLGGAYNISGPPVVLYGAMRRWPPERFFAVTQAFFLPISLMVMSGHFIAGFWTDDVLRLYAFALPLIIAASLVGARLARRFSAASLARAVYLLCAALGAMIVVTNLGG